MSITPTFFLVISRLCFVVIGNEVEHETLAISVCENAAFAADAFGHEHSSDAWRPDHAGWMELHILHVDQRRTGMIREGMSVTGTIPTVARDFVRFADSTSGENDRFRLKNFEMAALAIVPECADNAIAILQQRDDARLHVHIDPLMYAVILQRPNHFEARTIAHVRKSWILMAAKIPLENATIPRAIEHGAPRL